MAVDSAKRSVPESDAAALAGLLAEGSRFGAYVVGPCIRQSPAARVYRAQHSAVPGRPVALLVLVGGGRVDPGNRDRLVRQARAAATVRHPGVVEVFDVGERHGLTYVVRELIEGEDLSGVLSARGRIGEQELVALMVPLVAGLGALHEAGVVHGDLRPSSVFVPAAPSGWAKLIDFGMLRAGGADALALGSGTRGSWRGRPLYFSPEVVRGEDPTPASDQFSLGVVMYHALTGSNPFAAESFAEAVRRITSGEYPPFYQQAPASSPQLAHVVETAMHLDARQRYPDMAALGRALLEIAGESTRATWSLSFPETSAEVRDPSSVPPSERTVTSLVAFPQRPLLGVAPWKDPARFEWTTAAAFLVGMLSFAWAVVILLR